MDSYHKQGIPVSLRGLSTGGADHHFLSGIRQSRLCSAATSQEIELSWATNQEQLWDGHSLITHLRYTPAPAGAVLEEHHHWPKSVQGYTAFEHYAGHRSAIAIGIEPGVVMINRIKAPALDEHSTLADLERHQLRARFVLTDWHDSGASSWVLPLIAHHLPIAAGKGDAGATFLTPATLSGLEAIQQDFLGRVDIDAYPLAPDNRAYRDLIDPDNARTVALYGNPVELSRILEEAGRTGQENQFVQVSLATFLGYLLPTMPRLLAFQYGSQVIHPAAMEVAQGMLDTLHTTQSTFSGCTALSGKTEALPGNGYGFAQYASLPELAFLSDGGFAARILLGLHRATAVANGLPHAAQIAAAKAFYEWSEYQNV